MKRSRAVIPAALVLPLLLVGCVSTSAPLPSPSASAKNAHGNRPLGVGDDAITTLPTDDDVVTARFTVTGFELDPTCDGDDPQKPVNGHFLRVDITAETTPELEQDPSALLSFSAYEWEAYDSSGMRVNDPQGNGYSCLGSTEQLPAILGPDETVSGSVVLDVGSADGTVALTYGSQAGWEWNYDEGKD